MSDIRIHPAHPPNLRALPGHHGTMIRILALAATCLSSAIAWAAEPVFPPGSRIGLAPPEGMEVSKRFTGFENPAKGAAITLVEMPPEAYSQLEAGLTPEALKAQGLTLMGREETTIGGKDALVIAGQQSDGRITVRKWLLLARDPTATAFVVAQLLPVSDPYPEAVMQEALRTITLRPPLGIDDQIGALPFRLGERAGFRPVRVMAGNSILLTDGPKDTVAEHEQPLLIVAQSTGPAPKPDQRAPFARSALFASETLKEFAIERSQGFRQGRADWHEIVARAKDASSGQALVVMQTIRFTPEGYIRMVGITREDARDVNLPRFRRVIDSVENR